MGRYARELEDETNREKNKYERNMENLEKRKGEIIKKKKQQMMVCSVFDFVYLSGCMGKPTICIGENKGVDQLRSNCKADQRLCFRYTDSIICLLSKSKISSL